MAYNAPFSHNSRTWPTKDATHQSRHAMCFSLQ